jgi:cytochrome c-type biogenesis protein CcmH
MPERTIHRRRMFVLWLALGLAVGTGALRALAHEGPGAEANPAIEARMMAMAAELRCLVCQNQTIADSHAGLAEDLRQQIREMLAKGMSEGQIRAYMTERYGDFVLYRPPFKSSTALLWLGPALLTLVALGTLTTVLRHRQRMGADAFDPDTPDEEPDRVPNR